MKRVKLPTFEAIEADKQAARLEDGGLSHPVGTPFSIVSGPDYGRMIHEVTFYGWAALGLAAPKPA
jgi:hypothetical protein